MTNQTDTYLYGLTVQGIQSYIFGTNKLKEIIGASEIIEQICTTLFKKFLNDNTEIKGEAYLNAAGNIRFATTEDNAKKIVLEYGYIVNQFAPGLPFSQAIVKIKEQDLNETRIDLDNKLRAERNLINNHVPLGTMARSRQRRIGGFSSNICDEKHEDSGYLDAITNAKFTNSAGKLLTEKIKYDNKEFVYPSKFSELAKGGNHSWLAVVHIDGNKIGDTIRDLLDEHKQNQFTTLKNFSKNINQATINAFNNAVRDVFIIGEKAKKHLIEDGKMALPIRPIILGGDDITVIMRSDYALEFTYIYLKYFEDETKDITGLTACAGIAYVKEKFPFHYSVKLAEDLCVYAKDNSGRDKSCVQIHQVKDTTIEKYKDIIERELGNHKDDFNTSPFLLKEIDDILKNTELLSKENSPKNALRDWIHTKFNQPLMSEEILRRIKTKTHEDYENLVSTEELKNAIVYQTLLDVQIYEN